jgi:hypothetical protein
VPAEVPSPGAAVAVTVAISSKSCVDRHPPGSVPWVPTRLDFSCSGTCAWKKPVARNPGRPGRNLVISGACRLSAGWPSVVDHAPFCRYRAQSHRPCRGKKRVFGWWGSKRGKCRRRHMSIFATCIDLVTVAPMPCIRITNPENAMHPS